ncbi:putative MATH/TRAF domain-containing protein [Helianthus annuus]|nr:putative MATH/TRAF domain-containing protein [Helianthus annuus]
MSCRYILIYPQGCDVCNFLSLFLCVANHDKLLPGWSHFAQFTIAVVNIDPKKSKYSDTLHRFWKKEHDWGWKKFMESKMVDGFIQADTIIFKVQVQVIRFLASSFSSFLTFMIKILTCAKWFYRERVDRPFRCLDRQYRRELVKVYLTNVEQICRRYVEQIKGRLGKLMKDKARWSSFCNFWSGIGINSRRRMSREKSDSILKTIVKQFFIDKEVTSTLVMDSLHSGLKALEDETKNNKGKGKCDVEEVAITPVVQMEGDTFVLVDDVLLLLERAAIEQPLPPKHVPQNATEVSIIVP